jgi:UDP-N-acetylglucosamine--N-acetylmuramyl-(pentapeptide) pyrophosphoryl-undecaprenol N-acetylglucosamine transferase
MTAERPAPLRVLIAGGGTGGHLYPGIAIAEEVAAGGGEVLFVGTRRGLEGKLVPAAGFALELLEVTGLKRAGVVGKLRGLARLPRAFAESRRILRRFRPDVVVGVGGYASGPLVLAAALAGYPTVVQEQNSRPGLTNRVLGRFARRVFVAFEEARRRFAARKVRLVGNPVRRRFLDGAAAGEAAAPAPAAPGEDTILILGGSQGSHAVNEVAATAVQVLFARGRMPRVVHQTGPQEEDKVRLQYDALGMGPRVTVLAYIDDMPAALAGAALVVARAGALTLAELAMVGRPAILFPLPTAADDHQTMNALEFQRAGAAVMLPQYETSASQLADVVDEILRDPDRRGAMAAAMRGLARPQATQEIVAELRALIDGKKRP